jgi:hypothetical protein
VHVSCILLFRVALIRAVSCGFPVLYSGSISIFYPIITNPLLHCTFTEHKTQFSDISLTPRLRPLLSDFIHVHTPLSSDGRKKKSSSLPVSLSLCLQIASMKDLRYVSILVLLISFWWEIIAEKVFYSQRKSLWLCSPLF